MENVLVSFTNERAPKFHRDAVQILLNLNFQEFIPEMKKHSAFFNVKIDEVTLHSSFTICCQDEILTNKLAIKLDSIMPGWRSLN